MAYFDIGVSGEGEYYPNLFTIKSRTSTSVDGSANANTVTVTIPSDDCYILYGSNYTIAYGVSMRNETETTFSNQNGLSRIFEAVMNNNNLIGLVHYKEMANQSITITLTGISCYRMSATMYYK